MTRVIVHDGTGPVAPMDLDRILAATDEEIERQVAEGPDLAPIIPDDPGWDVVRRPPVPDVRAIRQGMGLSQEGFANRFHLSLRTLQEWEQGLAAPDRTARLFLMTIASAPDVVAAAVAHA